MILYHHLFILLFILVTSFSVYFAFFITTFLFFTTHSDWPDLTHYHYHYHCNYITTLQPDLTILHFSFDPSSFSFHYCSFFIITLSNPWQSIISPHIHFIFLILYFLCYMLFNLKFFIFVFFHSFIYFFNSFIHLFIYLFFNFSNIYSIILFLFLLITFINIYPEEE